jgi:glucosamine--fructose-6-phosphate aminotransferase (isomerizing)
MSIMWKEIFDQPAVMEISRKKNKNMIEKIVGKINDFKPHTVVFAGRGTSDHAGQYAKYLIEIYKGLPVSLASPSVISDYHGKLNLAGCLVIGISQSGMTEDVIEVLRAGNLQGALTLSITNNSESGVAKEAKYHLCCEAGPELSVAATKTFATQIYLLFDLIAQWSENQELLGLVDNIPEMVKTALSMSDEISSMVLRCRFMNEMFILARGINYPIAMEAALKMNESSYTRARPYSISDFHHGPFAMVAKDTPVMLIDTDKGTHGNVKPILEKLQSVKAEMFAITTDSELTKSVDSCLLIPAKYDGPASAFCVMALVQMFACKLAELKGDNPDAPRGLQKVTKG